MRSWLLALLALVVAGCSEPRSAPPPSAEVEVSAPPTSTSIAATPTASASASVPMGTPPPLANPPPASAYFPKGTFDARSQDFVSDWYAKHLVVMRELPLAADAKDAEALRFLWLRTWGKPVAIRVVKSGSGAELTAVRLSGSGGYEPGDVELYRRRSINEAEWRRLQDALAAAKFDTTPTSAEMGHDGAQWVLERAARGTYRLVERWTPKAEGAHATFRAACEAFLDLAGRDIVTGDVY